jgi:hypothetical protein
VLEVPMRTFPGLFVGRRTVMMAQEVTEGAEGTHYRCGACDAVILAENDPAKLRDVVVKCRCGEFNQL